MLFAFDCETFLFADGYKAPQPVCWTFSDGSIIHAKAAEYRLHDELTSGKILVGQNVAYDTVVMCEWYPDLIPLIFKAYDEDRITCTKLREQLIDTALGRFRGEIDSKTGEWVQRGYSLFDLARRYLGKTLDKDTWRLRYGELFDVPVLQWPAGALEYAIGDAVDTLKVAEFQEDAKDLLVDQFRQARAQFALALTSARGIRTDPSKVDVFAKEAEERYERLAAELQAHGILRRDKSADTKAAMVAMVQACKDEGIKPAMTKGGKVSLGADACERVSCPIIQAYSEFLTARKVLSADVEMLKAATRVCHPSYDLTKTGRCTCSKPNVQNLRKAPGIRECFVPEKGYVFIQCDYPSLELYTNAESCFRRFGYSILGDVLNADKDAHLMVAAQILGTTYEALLPRKKEPEVKAARQAAKAVNFGLPGGLGSARLVSYAKSTYGVDMTMDEAKDFAKLWKKTYPEMVAHLSSAGDLTESTGFGGETQISGQRTAGKTYSEIANERFQRLGADIAKLALYEVCRACFLTDGPLAGGYPVAFIHDEIIVEIEESKAVAGAKELSKIMCESANVWLKHVPMKLTGDVKLEPLIMRCWDKEAQPTYDSNGELTVWELAKS